MDFSEKWGKDVDEAVKLALAELKVSINEVDVTVLEESSKGFFGLGSKLAKVRVEKKQTVAGIEAEKVDEVKEAKEAKEAKEVNEVKKEQEFIKQKPATVKENVKKEPRIKKKKERDRDGESEKDRGREKEREQDKAEYERPEALESVEEHPALNFIKELAVKMDLELDIKAMKSDECIYIDIEGKDAGTFIGKRGQTLDAVQYLASLVANKDKSKYLRVVVDAEEYRNKRKKTLEQLADRLAGKVIKTKRSVRLEPMNPYERKVIHAKLQGNAKVITRSEGEEPFRRVVIEIK